MSTAFTTFMEGLIDYAGLFPPARLDLDTAIRNYARYRQEEDAWMLGAFIIPSSLLPALEPYGETLLAEKEEPFRFSVLLDTGNGEHRDWNFVREQIHRIDAFQVLHAGRVAVENVEARVSPFTERILSELEESGPGRVRLFLESADLSTIPAIADAGAGFKLRCGGTEPSAFPPVDTVAGAIDACRKAGVPMKCTAGLHHPVRSFREENGAVNHGFLNVFGGGILASVRGLSPERLQECLGDESPDSFRFDNGEFSWRDESVGADDIRRARREFATTFGSCSFDEPRDDLRALGLMD
jgi:hypothetical protein